MLDMKEIGGHNLNYRHLGAIFRDSFNQFYPGKAGLVIIDEFIMIRESHFTFPCSGY